ncbi:hypothetical protein P4E94_17770 [Pontiellaceae bacterium B12219]|nr:hypothetical protein [Pontiellaceae bacterium B12219]
MTNNKTYRRWRFASLKLSVIGTALLISASAFSQTKTTSGMNDAKTETSAVKRDPFWPVGFVPESQMKDEKAVVVKKPTGNNDWSGAMKKVVINGVSSRANNEFFAVINGAVKSENDTVSVEHEGTIYTWAVASIKPPGSVKLRRVSAL